MDRLPSSVRVGAVVLATALAFVLSLVVLPSVALADDSSMGGIAGDWYPLANTDIRMKAETVQATCYDGFAEFRADFQFVNSGPAQTLMLGFPFAYDPEDQGGLPMGFRAWQDGKPLNVSVGQGTEGTYEAYYLHQATFRTGTTMITVSYLANPSWSSGERFPELIPPECAAAGARGQDGRYDYWLHTGAGWAGTIGTAVLRFTLADDFLGYGVDVKASYPGVENGWPSTTRPETYTKLGDRTYQWVFKDVEPTKADDVELAFTGLFWSVDDSPADANPVSPGAMGVVVTSLQTSNPPDDSGKGEQQYWQGLGGPTLTLKGERPWVKMGIAGNRKLRELRIVPGRNDTFESFAEYGRPKTIKVTLSDGSSSTITLADEPSVQKFPLSATADWVRLDVLDSYPGSKSGDVCISNISLGNEPAPAFRSFDSLISAVSGSTGSGGSSTKKPLPPVTPPDGPGHRPHRPHHHDWDTSHHNHHPGDDHCGPAKRPDPGRHSRHPGNHRRHPPVGGRHT
jgi:hypothetical protein